MADFDAVLRTAFPDEYPRLVDAVREHPNPAALAKIFVDLAGHVTVAKQQQTPQTDPSLTKKRKLEDGVPPIKQEPNSLTNPTTAYDCKDVSFQIPTRKKLKLQLVADGTDASRQEIRLLNQQTNDLEHVVSAAQTDQIFLLPVPDKQQRQWSFCLFAKPDTATPAGAPCDSVVFTMNETAPVDAVCEGYEAKEDDTYVTVTEVAMNNLLRAQGKRVVRPSEGEFASSIPQAHRKGEKAYHVKAFRGSKEGYLFFVENGVVFVFKKPLAFFPFASIDSISYTSVLQRTFNLVITTVDAAGGEQKEIEFSMLDQADFAGIDEYIKRHGLNDASMAAERRAKKYDVNKEKKAEGEEGVNGEGGEDDGRTEIEKAEQALQDEEDEEEEDYEASGGESDGEGEDTDDEEEGEGEGGGDDEEMEDAEGGDDQ